MTARRHADQSATPTTPRGLVERLLAIARAANTKAGHLAIKSTSEGHGYCHYRPVGGHVVKVGRGFRIEGQTLVEDCGPACQAHQAAIAEAEAWLEAEAANAPQQLRMAV